MQVKEGYIAVAREKGIHLFGPNQEWGYENLASNKLNMFKTEEQAQNAIKHLQGRIPDCQVAKMRLVLANYSSKTEHDIHAIAESQSLVVIADTDMGYRFFGAKTEDPLADVHPLPGGNLLYNGLTPLSSIESSMNIAHEAVRQGCISAMIAELSISFLLAPFEHPTWGYRQRALFRHRQR